MGKVYLIIRNFGKNFEQEEIMGYREAISPDAAVKDYWNIIETENAKFNRNQDLAEIKIEGEWEDFDDWATDRYLYITRDNSILRAKEVDFKSIVDRQIQAATAQ